MAKVTRTTVATQLGHVTTITVNGFFGESVRHKYSVELREFMVPNTHKGVVLSNHPTKTVWKKTFKKLK